MNTIECIKSRYSVRKYLKDDVPDEVITSIIDAGRHAPSSGNVQDWEFIVVKKKETKQLLAEASYGQKFISEAPILIVVCTDVKMIESAYGERGVSLYSIQNTSAAIENILLACNEYGLGSCWVGSINESKVKDILILPTRIRPLAIITAGKAAAPRGRKRLRDIGEVLHKERW